MSASPIPAFVMSLLCILGGGIGFARKGSFVSLAAGLATGMLYLVAAKNIGDGMKSGYQGAFAASVLLTISSLPRITKGTVPKLLAMSSSAVGFYYSRSLY
ncbi:hypothetical protein HMN09_00664100 [Mycena chlorophos]|uniref:Uncharacterized protein n=2 Tax=Mycena chlorophos TaxID=658473 RepID=A0ABQ0LLS2_MYCCL|nr:hypothetical protein HMN09_00664100 [Mycena chlorophos]GAT51976.1 predicted protein [Mycena chlorophos]